MEFNPLRNSATLSGYACRFSHGVSPERPRNRAMNLFGGLVPERNINSSMHL